MRNTRKFISVSLALAAVSMMLSGCMESDAAPNVIYAPGVKETLDEVSEIESDTAIITIDTKQDYETEAASESYAVDTVSETADNLESEDLDVGSTDTEESISGAVQSDAADDGVNTESSESTSEEIVTKNGYKDGDLIGLDSSWEYAQFSVINSGNAVMYTAKENRKDKIIAVNAGHGTAGGSSVKTLCHPDGTPKVTGGTTAAGSIEAAAVSSGMTFNDGTPEAEVTLKMAQILRDKLLMEGYDVLMIRDGEDVQLDNVARTLIANNVADIHISLHWDGDGLDTIKGVFYMSVPDGLKEMEPVKTMWQYHEALGDALIEGLRSNGIKVWDSNPLDMDLTQTSYSTIPSVDIELGNQCSDHSEQTLNEEADGLVIGINSFFEGL